MEQESGIKFTGPGPFSLPVVQSVRVDSGTGVVTIVAKILVPDTQGQVSVSIRMIATVADDLLSQLPTAIVEARQPTAQDS